MYKAVVIGVSSGGIDALKAILPALPTGFPLPLAIVQHREQSGDNFLADFLNRLSQIKVQEAEDKEPLQPGHAYLAPAGYHLQIERDHCFSLSMDEPLHYARPAIDILFESAAAAYRNQLIGIVLTGANADGAAGLKTIRANGGLAIVQAPETAEAGAMPRAAIQVAGADHILEIPHIAPLLVDLTKGN